MENAMPEAVIFNHHNKIHTVFFSQSNAVLPVKLKNGAFIAILAIKIQKNKMNSSGNIRKIYLF
jgi:hypothetical protein